MKNLILFTLIVLHSVFSNGQIKLTTYKPTKQHSPDLSIKTQNEIKRQSKLLENENLTQKEQIELDELLNKYGEVIENVWNILGSECDWYCGGGNYKVYASSELQNQNSNNYSSKSANDLSYKTAWIEGKKNSGIGEFIEFSFKNKSPRITAIIISNGYLKTNNTWKNNNRVKYLKLSVNGKEYGILELTDTKTDQRFELATFGKNKNGSDLILKFEILEVYRGEKYDDTAITEIYFDGIDVH